MAIAASASGGPGGGKGREVNFNTLLDSFRMLEKMGSITKVLGMIPGSSSMVSEEQLDSINPKLIARTKAIILSMTLQERSQPELVAFYSRQDRIAAGSGTKPSDVQELLGQLRKMQDGMGGMGRRFS